CCPTAQTSLLATPSTAANSPPWTAGVGTTFQLVPLKRSASVWAVLPLTMSPTAQISLSAIAAVPNRDELLINGLGTTWKPVKLAGSASVFAATPAASTITNTNVRIALNPLLTDREEMIVAAIMLILEMMNNMGLASPVGFILGNRNDVRYGLQQESNAVFTFIRSRVAVSPDLLVRDENGEIYTVRYDAVNAMLLNEFLKEHRKVEEQQATITELKSTVARQQKDFQATAAHQQKQIEALTAGLEKVSAQLEVIKPAPQTILSNQ